MARRAKLLVVAGFVVSDAVLLLLLHADSAAVTATANQSVDARPMEIIRRDAGVEQGQQGQAGRSGCPGRASACKG